jgi:hypothetical protein
LHRAQLPSPARGWVRAGQCGALWAPAKTDCVPFSFPPLRRRPLPWYPPTMGFHQTGPCFGRVGHRRSTRATTDVVSSPRSFRYWLLKNCVKHLTVRTSYA